MESLRGRILVHFLFFFFVLLSQHLAEVLSKLLNKSDIKNEVLDISKVEPEDVLTAEVSSCCSIHEKLVVYDSHKEPLFFFFAT